MAQQQSRPSNLPSLPTPAGAGDRPATLEEHLAFGERITALLSTMTFSQVCDVIDRARPESLGMIGGADALVLRASPPAAVAAHVVNDVPLDRSQSDDDAFAAPSGPGPSLHVVR